MKIRVHVEGLKEVRDALASLPSATTRTIMRKILVARAEPFKDSARAMAPRDTGFLAETIRVQSRTGGGAGKAAFAAVMAAGGSRASASAAARGANSAAKSAVEVFIGPNAGPREIAAEFGTKDRMAQPFMRPSWDTNKMAALDNIRTDLWIEVKKAIKRRERKAAKLAAAADVEG
jgi:HK97 gp10 family phage protein